MNDHSSFTESSLIPPRDHRPWQDATPAGKRTEQLIRICTSEPSVPHAGGGAERVKDTAALLLRILLLAPDPRVPVDGAAAVMGIARSGFGQYVAQLRGAFGDDDLVVRTGGSVLYAGDRTRTDAAVIEGKHRKVVDSVRASAGGRVVGSGTLELEVIDEILAQELLPELQEIQRTYSGNPSMGLSGFQMANMPDRFRQWAMELDDVASDWMQRWSSVQLLLADCHMLTSPTRQTGRELLKRLLKLARSPDPHEEVFPRLLKAAKLSGDVRHHREAWELTCSFYAQEEIDFPDDLHQLAPIAPRPVPAPRVPYRARPPYGSLEPVGEPDDSIREVARLLGITSVLRLRGAEVEPAECIARTTRRLYFSGVLASKWVIGAGIRSDFDKLLARLDEQVGEGADVRFLIIDPEGDAYSELYQLRGGRLSKESVPLLQDLVARHPCFEVRVVNALPSFRIVVIDDDFVTFSLYSLEGERYATSKAGWEAPHVMLDPLAPYPLADAFRLYFEERWSTARALQLPSDLARRTRQ